MALNEIFNIFFKKINITKNRYGSINAYNWNYILYIFLIIIFFIIFVISSNFINKKNELENQNLDLVVKSSEFTNLSDLLISKINSPYEEVKYLIQNNDSIEKILKKFEIRAEDTKIISYNLKQKKLTNIYAGRELLLILKKLDDGSKTVVNLLYPINNTTNVEIRKNNDDYLIKENILQLYKKEVVVRKEITNNLYSAAIEAGIEPNIIIEFARIFGFEVDFQRDIRKGNWFEILYEKFEDDNNVTKDTGKIIYASMYVNGEEINLYNFKHDNEIGYYDISGKSIVKSLMKTPINGARLSSSFGNRKHPILGYTKLHAGTDFAAPSGTPIMASGAGTITRARWCGGGGNCVKIKHNSTYQTIYAHMKNFARGIKEGKKVKQGQIIGYVGSTGMSTGPHLHYEVIVNGRKVNSQKLKLPSGKILKGNPRKNFEVERIKIDLRLSSLR
ncbi:peptidoglycan DD-metalloendopeptidase family protein [Pelagibacteraceae bacterium]|nr:peptidoglycan DD-metalloendopeptidase family protein [Pelagibacteraceae bacterium]